MADVNCNAILGLVAYVVRKDNVQITVVVFTDLSNGKNGHHVHRLDPA